MTIQSNLIRHSQYCVSMLPAVSTLHLPVLLFARSRRGGVAAPIES